MKKNSTSRRQFIAATGKAGLAAGLSFTALPSLLNATSAPMGLIHFEQKPLPYSYHALEPVIDTMTMEIHYSKHAAAYAKNLADACAAEGVNTSSTSVEKLLKNVSKYSSKMRNNAGGHYNHEFFWNCMKPGTPSTPSGTLAKAIDKNFGSLEAFQTQFSDAGKNRFGSGWAWLVCQPGQKLVVSSTPNQDNPLMDTSEVKGIPLLGLDVWEHAYYLKYQNKRADYITNWWKLVNWDFVQQQFSK